MIKPGKIVIKEKVYFEPKGLEKPNKDHYNLNELFVFESYQRSLIAYEASKRVIEISNEQWSENNKDISAITIRKKIELIENNTPCKAEINGTAKIIKLIK